MEGRLKALTGSVGDMEAKLSAIGDETTRLRTTLAERSPARLDDTAAQSADLAAKLASVEALSDGLSALRVEFERSQRNLEDQQAKSSVDAISAAVMAGMGGTMKADLGLARDEIRDELDGKLRDLTSAVEKQRVELVELRDGIELLKGTQAELTSSLAETEKKVDQRGASKVLAGGVSLEEVREEIDLAVAKYDRDKTGMVDFALESSGRLFPCSVEGEFRL